MPRDTVEACIIAAKGVESPYRLVHPLSYRFTKLSRGSTRLNIWLATRTPFPLRIH